MPNNYRRITNSLLTHLCLARAEHPARQSIARRLSLGARFRRQPLAPAARPCGLRGLTARRGQAKRGHHAMNADNRRHDDLGKGNCPMGKTPPKTLLTCGASYKPPALPGDTYYKAVRPSPAHHRFAVGDSWQASVPQSDLPAFPTKFDCETLEALLAALSYRKGASHDGSSTTDD